MVELQAVKDKLKDLTGDVLDGKVDRSDAAVVGQLWNTYDRVVSVELKAKEQQELEERLEELESAIAQREAQQ